ncbi:hypothetical protein [Methanocalculus sp.]|uniref:hypothetical protein n=1 Tax=Methanocalculus sp. TaxID=2004547 RepID=UPI00260C0C98|nr:hypothetical protein [Methanocalculus sp.]MDG6251116.1 hypothetical protein [Methanocalculus sp.]
MSVPSPGNPRIVYTDQVEALVRESPFLERIGDAMERIGVWKIVDREDAQCIRAEQ